MSAHIFIPGKNSIDQLAVELNAETWELREEYSTRKDSISIDKPLTGFKAKTKSILHQWLFDAPAKAEIELNNGLIYSKQGILYENNCNLVGNKIKEGWNKFSALHVLAKRIATGANPAGIPPGWGYRSKEKLLCKEPLTIATTHNNPNFFHWLTAPGSSALHLVEHFGLVQDPKTLIALGNSRKPHLQTYALEISKSLKPESQIILGNSIKSAAHTLFAMQSLETQVAISPSQIKWIAGKRRANLKTTGERHKRVFISRANASKRRCTNEDELKTALENYNFEFISLEGLSLEKQHQVFASSEAIMGVHGAGLTNIVSCKPGTIIIEIVSESEEQWHYYLMSDILGLKHAHTRGIKDNKSAPNSNDLKIDPSSVIKLMHKLGLKELPKQNARPS